MQRLRLTFIGKVWGIIPVKGCLTKTVTESDLAIAEGIMRWLDGTSISWGILKGTIYVTVGREL